MIDEFYLPAPVLTDEALDRWLAHHTDALDARLMARTITQDQYDRANASLNQRYEHYIEALACYDRLAANARK